MGQAAPPPDVVAKTVAPERLTSTGRPAFDPRRFLVASTAGAYAESVRSRFLDVTNGRGLVCRDFLDARGMERLYRRTVLNVHPCAYDAYGKSVLFF